MQNNIVEERKNRSVALSYAKDLACNNIIKKDHIFEWARWMKNYIEWGNIKQQPKDVLQTLEEEKQINKQEGEPK